MYLYCLPSLLYCWLATIFLICVNILSTSIDILLRYSVISSYITTSVYPFCCLSGQILLSQQVPMLFFHIFILLGCVSLCLVSCLVDVSSGMLVTFSSLLPSFAFMLHLSNLSGFLFAYNMAYVVSAHSICCLLMMCSFSWVHIVGNLLSDSSVLHLSLHSCDDASCLFHYDLADSAVVLFRPMSDYHLVCSWPTIFPLYCYCWPYR